MLLAGKISGFMLLLIVSGAIIYSINRASAGKLPPIRRIPALDAIDEVIGRCVEMGRPVHVSPGRGGLVDVEAPQTLAGLDCLAYVAKQCAAMNAAMIATVCQAEVYPVAEAIVQEAYREQGKIDQYRPEMVRFLSPNQFAFAAGIMGIFEREKVAGNILIGLYFAESLLLIEAGNIAGVMQVGGTANTLQTQFFVAGCDYFLIGEEIFVAGAYLSKDPVRLGSLAGQDIGKAIFMALIVIGVLARTMGSKFMLDLLGK